MKEISLALRSLLLREKIIFLALAIIFLIGAMGLWFELQKTFTLLVPVEGGSIHEGMIGTPYLINPLLANTDADRDLTQLIYAGLMKADDRGGLENELAESFSIAADGLSYTFILKENLVWHDGEAITSEDIVFTIQAAKNPAMKSPVRANWEGVEVEVIDERTVRFWLKKPYAPFMENTTLGILPKHIWKNATPEQFSLSEFNRRPVGAGPYVVKTIQRNSAGIITAYELKSFKKYALGRPKIEKIKLTFYNSEPEEIAAFARGDVDSLGSVSSEGVAKLNADADRLKTMTLPRIFGLFFNQNRSEVLRDKKVREALNMTVDKERLVQEALGGHGTPLERPLPPGILGLRDQKTVFNPEQAQEILDAAGWKIDAEDGIRTKKQKSKPDMKLAFSIATANTTELVKTAEMLKNMWREIGADIALKFFEIGDLNQNVIRPREYEGLLFGQVIGRNPDLFAFWHSSQRNDPGLNVALYANKNVDGLLEAARATQEFVLRQEKYQKFLEEIQKDIPAIFVYSPYYLYIAPSSLKGFETNIINVPAERFANIHKWHLYQTRVWKIFID